MCHLSFFLDYTHPNLSILKFFKNDLIVRLYFILFISILMFSVSLLLLLVLFFFFFPYIFDIDTDSSLIFSSLYFIMFMFKNIYFLAGLILAISLQLYLISCICIITQFKLLYISHWDTDFSVFLSFVF